MSCYNPNPDCKCRQCNGVTSQTEIAIPKVRRSRTSRVKRRPPKQAPKPKRKKKNDRWLAGAACVCAWVAKDDGYVGNGARIAEEMGFDLQELKDDPFVEPIDVEDLEKDGLL